ncbi:hypothetical protein ACIBO2_53465 [Nonomuraea sp. NPDC050022]|uniref:hypothetical protein n=1 Tax=unclassified Nonomuraea TaxID=2593643 RepID=UPI0033D5DB2D
MKLINGVPPIGALVAVADASWARRRHVVVAGAGTNVAPTSARSTATCSFSIFVLAGGRNPGQATHRDLMAAGNRCARLFATQASGHRVEAGPKCLPDLTLFMKDVLAPAINRT